MSTALAITRTDAVRAVKRAATLERVIARGKEHEEELATGAVRTITGGGVALGLGLVRGAGVFKNGEILGTVPVELGVGLTMHGLRLLGIFGGKGKWAEHLGTMGDAGVFTYLYTLGVGMGSEHWGAKGGSHGQMGGMGGAFADRLANLANST